MRYKRHYEYHVTWGDDSECFANLPEARKCVKRHPGAKIYKVWYNSDGVVTKSEFIE